MRRIKKYNSEQNIHLRLIRWIRKQYPTVIPRTDYAAGKKMNKQDAAHHSNMQGNIKSYPDIFLAEPRGIYCGLYIELKQKDVSIFKQNGDIRGVEHIQNQLDMLNTLYAKGYAGAFAVGIESAQRLINWYMRLPSYTESPTEPQRYSPRILTTMANPIVADIKVKNNEEIF